jgi:hypothetical protein
MLSLLHIQEPVTAILWGVSLLLALALRANGSSGQSVSDGAGFFYIQNRVDHTVCQHHSDDGLLLLAPHERTFRSSPAQTGSYLPLGVLVPVAYLWPERFELV